MSIAIGTTTIRRAAKDGEPGAPGTSYTGTKEYYALSQSSQVTPGGDNSYPAEGSYNKNININYLIKSPWSTDMPVESDSYPSKNNGIRKSYIWNFEVSSDSDGNHYVTKPVCIGNFAKGIVSVVESYGISASKVGLRHEIEVYADQGCTRRATGVVNDVFVKLGRDYGVNDGVVYFSQSSDGECLSIGTPSEEYPDDTFCINSYIDFISDDFTEPLRKDQVVECSYNAEYLDPIDVTDYKTSFGNVIEAPADITWTDNPQYAAPTENKPYQWNKTVTTYSDGTTEVKCHISAVKGDQGDNGSDATQPNLFGYACPITSSSLAVPHTASGLATWIVKSSGQVASIYVRGISLAVGRKVIVHGSVLSAAAITLKTRLIYADGSYSTYDQTTIAANTESTDIELTNKTCEKELVGVHFYLIINAAMNGMFRISNLKIEDSTELLGDSTPYNGLAVQQLSVRPNIIPDTQFLKRSKWATFDGSVLSKEYLGLNVFKASKTVAAGGNAKVLEMNLTGLLKANTFYTLSYWIKASSSTNTRIDSYIQPNVSDTNLIMVYDGVPNQGRKDNAIYNSSNLTTWRKRSITFRTASSLSSGYNFRIVVYNTGTSASISRDLYIAQPKLEEGDYATDYCQSEEDKHGTRGAFSILKWSEIAHGYHFYDAKAVGDMEIADVVIDDTTAPYTDKYICTEEHIYDSSEYSKPSAKAGIYWQQIDNLGIVATDLLLSDQIYARVLQAVNARIDNLILNRAQATDADGNVTVSIDGTTGLLEARRGKFNGIISETPLVVNSSNFYSYFDFVAGYGYDIDFMSHSLFIRLESVPSDMQTDYFGDKSIFSMLPFTGGYRYSSVHPKYEALNVIGKKLVIINQSSLIFKVSNGTNSYTIQSACYAVFELSVANTTTFVWQRIAHGSNASIGVS